MLNNYQHIFIAELAKFQIRGLHPGSRQVCTISGNSTKVKLLNKGTFQIRYERKGEEKVGY
jgi:hypothetical protein